MQTKPIGPILYQWDQGNFNPYQNKNKNENSENNSLFLITNTTQ